MFHHISSLLLENSAVFGSASRGAACRALVGSSATRPGREETKDGVVVSHVSCCSCVNLVGVVVCVTMHPRNAAPPEIFDGAVGCPRACTLVPRTRATRYASGSARSVADRQRRVGLGGSCGKASGGIGRRCSRGESQGDRLAATTDVGHWALSHSLTRSSVTIHWRELPC